MGDPNQGGGGGMRLVELKGEDALLYCNGDAKDSIRSTN
jgi:hypothetical protein